MPTYSYLCDSCKKPFELFAYIKDYVPNPCCIHCQSNNTNRYYQNDLLNISASIIKHDSELKTIGDIANRNRDRMSDDQKAHLQAKHNEYKEQESQKQLPQGMSRIKKPNKIKWR